MDKEASINSITQEAKQSFSNAASKEDGWFTQAQIAHKENITVEQAADLVKHLKSKPSRHPHLKNDKNWVEYYYVGNMKFNAEKK